MVLTPAKKRGKKLPRRRLSKRQALFICCAAGITTPAFAQNEPAWVLDLPQPGYEPRNLRVGTATVEASVETGLEFNSNIFATPNNEEEDLIVRIGPEITAASRWRNYALGAGAYANFRRFLENERENTETFGVNATVIAEVSREHKLSTEVRYDRSFERRDDPDANSTAADPLTKIDIVGANIRYEFRPGRFGLAAGAGVSKSNYLSVQDDDRDMTTFNVSTRALAGVSPDIDAFVEGYLVFRDARLDVDRNGVNRDTDTFGVRAGIAVDLTEKLTGEVSAGIFDANPQDPTLDDFSGFSASGRLRWSPRARTGVVLSVFRGDVATIRTGASGRIDTRLGVEVIQEVLHNVRVRGGVGYREGEFRTVNPQIEEDVTARVGGEYLLNRHIAVNADYRFRSRNSTLDTDDFNMHSFGVSLTLQY